MVEEEDVLRAALEQLAVEEGIDVDALLTFNRQKLTRSAKRSRSVSRDPRASSSVGPAVDRDGGKSVPDVWADGFTPDFGGTDVESHFDGEDGAEDDE